MGENKYVAIDKAVQSFAVPDNEKMKELEAIF